MIKEAKDEIDKVVNFWTANVQQWNESSFAKVKNRVLSLYLVTQIPHNCKNDWFNSNFGQYWTF